MRLHQCFTMASAASWFCKNSYSSNELTSMCLRQLSSQGSYWLMMTKLLMVPGYGWLMYNFLFSIITPQCSSPYDTAIKYKLKNTLYLDSHMSRRITQYYQLKIFLVSKVSYSSIKKNSFPWDNVMIGRYNVTMTCPLPVSSCSRDLRRACIAAVIERRCKRNLRCK